MLCNTRLDGCNSNGATALLAGTILFVLEELYLSFIGNFFLLLNDFFLLGLCLQILPKYKGKTYKCFFYCLEQVKKCEVNCKKMFWEYLFVEYFYCFFLFDMD